MTTTSATVTVVALPAAVVTDIDTVLGWMLGLLAVACVAKIIFVGARMAWDHQHTAGVESPVMAELLAAVLAWILGAVAAGGIAAALLNSPGGAPTDTPTDGTGSTIIGDIERVNPPLKEAP